MPPGSKAVPGSSGRRWGTAPQWLSRRAEARGYSGVGVAGRDFRRTRPKWAASPVPASRAPSPTESTSSVRPGENSPTPLNSVYPATKFAIPQITFTTGEDSPTPGGEANGLWNRWPEMPLTK